MRAHEIVVLSYILPVLGACAEIALSAPVVTHCQPMSLSLPNILQKGKEKTYLCSAKN